MVARLKEIEMDDKSGPYDIDLDLLARQLEQQAKRHEQDRDALFANERFVIGVMQVVSGGATLAAIGQAEQLVKLTSDTTMRLGVTLSCVGLLMALAAAFFKHQYKMWDVKFRAMGDTLKDSTEAKRRARLASRYLRYMRNCMWGSFIAMVIFLLQLVAALWLHVAR
jgi:hypothetical protein